jgi:hypothetical protein
MKLPDTRDTADKRGQSKKERKAYGFRAASDVLADVLADVLGDALPRAKSRLFCVG